MLLLVDSLGDCSALVDVVRVARQIFLGFVVGCDGMCVDVVRVARQIFLGFVVGCDGVCHLVSAVGLVRRRSYFIT